MSPRRRYAIQLAKLAGLKVATTASPAKHELVKSLGADVVVDYKVCFGFELLSMWLTLG